MTIWGGVGDVLPVRCPFDFITAVLHQPNEMLPVMSQRHALVDVDLQIHLPTIALGIGTVLPVRHGAFFLLQFGFHDRKTVLQTQLIGCIPQHFQTFLVAVVFSAGFTADGVDDEVGVDVGTVGVGRHHHLKAGELLCQF